MERQLVIDTWEGQLEIDEATLLSNGVAGMIIRLNDMNGGHHMDENFSVQWQQARAFCRAPYFVYNPWVNGFSNYTWLASHMPSDAKAVLLDIEVRMSGYPPSTYAAEVKKFFDLVRLKWHTAIYTGEAFLPMLSSWPAADYWWAQYPYEFYRDQDIHLTWDELRARLQKYDRPFNASKIPGALRMWQFTGDTLILPGNPRIMDVNVFYGSRAELEDWLGKPAISQPSGDTITAPYPGIKRVTGTRHGWPFSLLISDPKKVQFEVAHFEHLTTGTLVAKSSGAEVVVNGGEWDRVSMPKDYSVSNGVLYVARKAAVPSLMVLSDGSLTISHRDGSNVKQAISGLRYLIQGGQIKKYLYDPSDPLYETATATEGHSRSIHGLDGNGHHLCLTSGGRYPNQGLTLKQAADILKQYGAVTAFDSGGGGDVTEVIDGELANTPENIVLGVNVQRLLPQFLLIYAGGTSMPATAISTTHELSLRPLHQTVSSSTILKIPINTTVPVTEVWVAPETTAYNNKDDLWALVTYAGKTGWVGLVHLGVKYGTYSGAVTPEPEPEPEPGLPATWEHTLVAKDGAGNVLATYKGTLVKQP